ncbi:hypothetical protein [Cupriavidus metallidurans]|jgi:hypothetical protein|uniref:hypothetical protein n=1 Tax=Cupriavidus metallidurans TaxID=119219 RepID=UPI001BFC5F8F|nr:hypothetical protein [Cupriavidus metallidurans]QWC87528.1 hypothetical protein KB891_10720 [Cupriavidus metallidurans]
MTSTPSLPLNGSSAVRIDSSAGILALLDEADARLKHALALAGFLSQVKELHSVEERDMASLGSLLWTLLKEHQELIEVARKEEAPQRLQPLKRVG